MTRNSNRKLLLLIAVAGFSVFNLAIILYKPLCGIVGGAVFSGNERRYHLWVAHQLGHTPQATIGLSGKALAIVGATHCSFSGCAIRLRG
jgi:hypothetical protein